MQQFVIDIRLDSEELPDLPVLEGDLQDMPVLLIRERPDLGIEYWNGRHLERRNKVRAVLNLLFALLQNTRKA